MVLQTILKGWPLARKFGTALAGLVAFGASAVAVLDYFDVSPKGGSSEASTPVPAAGAAATRPAVSAPGGTAAGATSEAREAVAAPGDVPSASNQDPATVEMQTGAGLPGAYDPSAPKSTGAGQASEPQPSSAAAEIRNGSPEAAAAVVQDVIQQHEPAPAGRKIVVVDGVAFEACGVPGLSVSAWKDSSGQPIGRFTLRVPLPGGQTIAPRSEEKIISTDETVSVDERCRIAVRAVGSSRPARITLEQSGGREG